MRHEIRFAESSFEQIQIFCQFAEKWKSDFALPQLKKFLNMDLADVAAFVRSKYCLEKGEQILRPAFFAQIGSDCDDGTIFTIALLRAAGVSKNLIYIVEAKEAPQEKDYVHIFCALKDPKTGKMIWIDNLPGTRFAKLNYSMSQIRVTPFTDYL